VAGFQVIMSGRFWVITEDFAGSLSTAVRNYGDVFPQPGQAAGARVFASSRIMSLSKSSRVKVH
jgi:hypothetical protein